MSLLLAFLDFLFIARTETLLFGYVAARTSNLFFNLLSVILKTDLLSEAVTGRINFWDKSTAFAVTASQ